MGTSTDAKPTAEHVAKLFSDDYEKLSAERDTLKALCFDLLNELEAYCHDGECDELQDRARSILK